MTIQITCPNCSYARAMPEEKLPQGARWAVCPRCRERFELPFYGASFDFEQAGEGPARSPGPRRDTPWERRSELGTLNALYETFKSVLFSPGALFSGMRVEGGLREPLAFGLLWGSIGSMFGYFWMFLMMWGGMLTAAEGVMSRQTMTVVFFAALVLSPAFVTLGIIISSAVIHLFLLVVRGAKNGFEATFRVVSYSQAPKVLGLIPFIGGFIGSLWRLVVQIVGLREMHETSYLKVIIAFLLPLFLALAAVIAGVLSLAPFG